MAKAKTLNSEQFQQVLDYVATTSRHPVRDCVVLLLSFKGGLRAAEIAGLDWENVTDAFGAIRKDAFEIPPYIAKKGHGREVPMHPDLYEGLCLLRDELGPELSKPTAPIIRSIHRVNASGRVSPNAMQRYIGRLYDTMGLTGCSSHSGRRSFITTAARVAGQHDCSLRDVQAIVGHAYINTTQGYVEPSERIRSLVEAL